MDPRIARTRRSLSDALFALARERPLEEISISDIADRAGVNRSTYYQHYSDKNTLLADALDDVIDQALGDYVETDMNEAQGAGILRGYLVHVEQNAELYRVLLGENGSAAIQVRMTNRLQMLLSLGLAANEHPVPEGLEELPLPVVAAALAGAALATIRAWLELDPRPSGDVATRWVWAAMRIPIPLPQ